MGLRDGQPGAVIGQQRGTGGVSLRGGRERSTPRAVYCGAIAYWGQGAQVRCTLAKGEVPCLFALVRRAVEAVVASVPALSISFRAAVLFGAGYDAGDHTVPARTGSNSFSMLWVRARARP